MDWTDIGLEPRSTEQPTRGSAEALGTLATLLGVLSNTAIDASGSLGQASDTEQVSSSGVGPSQQSVSDECNHRAAGGGLGGSGSPGASADRGDP